eukprot:2897962-Rhodomonas_salina.1
MLSTDLAYWLPIALWTFYGMSCTDSVCVALPERVSVTRTCAKALLQCAKQKGGGSQEEEVGLLGVLTNAVQNPSTTAGCAPARLVFEDKGKEQLLSLESKYKSPAISYGAPTPCPRGEGVLGRVLELAGTSTSTGGSSSTVAGLVQARALRLLVNASSAEALRKSLIPHHAPEVTCPIAYALSGTAAEAVAGYLLRRCYALSGTDAAYAVTRRWLGCSVPR